MDSIISYCIVGVISMLTGIISINILVEEENRSKYNNTKTYLTFLTIGIIIHTIVQTIDLDQIYCDKKCQLRLLN